MADDYVDIPFGPYLPDRGGAPTSDIPGYLTDAIGVRLTPNGYRGMPTFADVASATAVGTDNTSMQGWGVTNPTGSRSFFVHNVVDAKLYQSLDDGVTWGDVSPAAGAAPAAGGDLFIFESDVIHVSSSRAPIAKDSSASSATKFTALPGSPPTALCGAQVRQHVVLGGISGATGSVQWCAIGDAHDWPTPGSADALAKEAGSESLPQAQGGVYKILGGEKVGIVVQQTGLTRMTYEGGDTVFAIDTYETKIGSGNGSATGGLPTFTTDGVLWYWVQELGIFATDGYSVNRLSEGKISDSIFNDLMSHPLALQSLNYGSAAYDTHRQLVIFGSASSDYQRFYCPANGSFSWMNEVPVQCLFSQAAPASFTGKSAGSVVYNINHTSRKLQALTAGSPTIAMQTGYIEIEPGHRVQLHGAHLLGSGSIGSLALSYKTAADQSACDVVQTGFTALTAQTLGMKRTARASSQFIAFRITGTSSEAHLLRGIRVYYAQAEPSP